MHNSPFMIWQAATNRKKSLGALYAITARCGLQYLNQSLISRIQAHYTTCTTRNIRCPLNTSNQIELDCTDNLYAGDSIRITQPQYGGSALPSYAYQTHITAIDGRTVHLREDIPQHFRKYSSGLVIQKLCQHRFALKQVRKSAEIKEQCDAIEALFDADHIELTLSFLAPRNATHIKVVAALVGKKNVGLQSVSLDVISSIPVVYAFLKNRTLRVLKKNPLTTPLWLWKEGVYASDGALTWSIHSNPNIASAELHPAKLGKSHYPWLRLNLLHSDDQHFRRHQENFTNNYTFSTFSDLSCIQLKPGQCKKIIFSIHAGQDLVCPPRVSLVPSGFRAAHVWTEHADKTELRTHRAVYYGHEDITEAKNSTGGFCKHSHVVTKSVFYSNPTTFRHKVWHNGKSEEGEVSLAYQPTAEFKQFLTELADIGCDICLHGLYPADFPASQEAVANAIREFTNVFRSPVWIDHGMQDTRLSIGWQGSVPFSSYYLCDHLKQNNIRFVWTWSSTDFMSKNRLNINLLHNDKGEHLPTPLYWRSSELPAGFVIWASHEASLSAYTEQNVKGLIESQGISIQQHYYPYVEDDRYNFEFLEKDTSQKYKTTKTFESILCMMRQHCDKGDLLITTISALVQYWLAIENIEFLLSKNGFTVINKNSQPIKGLSMYIKAKQVYTEATSMRSKQLSQDCTLIWFDLDALSKVVFELKM